ncbi:hypothetical protein QBC37DRAFT_380017 [Rhypophila decipiens]|uniref:Uncharacterized protein n=1 Tax=Rhypophila decipiens TaxID=261697 RepID=A0AAN7B256_9PEZI|nr:hypothetical protein QBC37DRAFT_380017 [Rhypophila decipiens]
MAIAAAAVSAIAAPGPRITPPPVLVARAFADAIPQNRLGAGGVIDPGLTASNEHQSSCIKTDYLSIVRDMPAPTGALRSWIENEAEDSGVSLSTVTALSQVDGFCETHYTETVTPPASLASALSSYSSEFTSWQKSIHDQAMSIGDRCGGPLEGMFDAIVATDVAECKAAASAVFNAGSGKNAGPRQTGCVSAVAAIAGLAVAMALL